MPCFSPLPSSMDHPHCLWRHTPSYIFVFIHPHFKWSSNHVWREWSWISFIKALPGHCGQGQCGMWELVVVVIWLMLWNVWSCQWDNCQSIGGSGYWVWPCFWVTTQNFTLVYPVLFLLQHWQRLGPQGPGKPGLIWSHAATSFTQSQQGNLILVIGGCGSKHSWIFDMRTITWKRVSVVNNWAMAHALTQNTHWS